jgi:Skp family chaperone for outer membrane proteins
MAWFFLKTNKMKIKGILFVLIMFFNVVSYAQKAQRIAYIDMNYILENVPEYINAQSKLDDKVKIWQQKLDTHSNEIEKLKTDLSNEKSLLTKELINEREEDIIIKENELKRLQNAYFGPTGDLFQLRKQLATPVQDQVYNAIQEIAKRKRFDFVLDKSSDLILLYSNSKFDISEQVLNSIVKNRKRKVIADRKKENLSKAGAKISTPVILDNPDEEGEITNDSSAIDEENEIEKTDKQKKIDERNAKREALKARIKEQQEARAQIRDSLKKVAEEKRAAKLKEIEDRKKKRDEEIENKN